MAAEFLAFVGIGSQTDRIKSQVLALANNVRGVVRYVRDTENSAGQADYDLEFAAEVLEHAAREATEAANKLRETQTRIELMRDEQKQRPIPVLMTVE